MSWLQFASAAALAASGVAETEMVAPVSAAAPDLLQVQDERFLRMTIPVMINGQGPFHFMIDTGAQASVLSHTLAEQLQLFDRESARLVGMASERVVETTIIDELTFGSGSHRNSVAAIVAGENIGGADGILGLDSLQNRRVLIDFENRLMEVAHPQERADNRGFDIVVRARSIAGQLIITRAEIDGVSTAVIVDTGAQGSIGNAALLRRLRNNRPHADVEMTDINGVQASGRVRLARSLVLERASINNFLITFTDSPTFSALGLEDEPAMILGMTELRLFRRVAIDFASRRVLFDLPRGTRLPETEIFGRI